MCLSPVVSCQGKWFAKTSHGIRPGLHVKPWPMLYVTGTIRYPAERWLSPCMMIILEITNPGTLHFGITPEKLTKPHESRPWNPIIANVFYRAGIIERWGSGTLNIIDWCIENGNPTPAWSEQSGSVYVTFRPAVLPDVQPVAAQSTAQVPDKYPTSIGEDGTKSALSRHQVEILRKCQEDNGVTGSHDDYRPIRPHQVQAPSLESFA